MSELATTIVVAGVVALLVTLAALVVISNTLGTPKPKRKAKQSGPDRGLLDTFYTEGDPRAHIGTPTHRHTHRAVSEHYDQGRRVVVKKCEECGDIRRDMD